MPDQPQPRKIDVAKPGSTPPDPTSRPLIVTNRPVLKDPMVKESEKEATLSQTGKTIPSPTELIPKKKPSPALHDELPKSEEPKPPEQPLISDNAVIDKLAEKSAGKNLTKADPKAKEEEDKKVHINKLVQEKTYFLPIGKVTQRKQNKQLIVVFAVILIAAAAFFLLKLA